jgi:hypothetical protein
MQVRRERAEWTAILAATLLASLEMPGQEHTTIRSPLHRVHVF